jgi:hypothetical protein
MHTPQTIPTDPSLPPTPDIAALYPGYYCDCLQPVPVEGAERNGARVTYCARCEREVGA